MRFSFATIVAGVAGVAAQADGPLEFYAQLFHESSTCASGGRTSAFVKPYGACINLPVPGTGSAQIRVGEVSKHFLGGWTGPDCTGTVVLVESNLNSCIDFDGTKILSWSNDDRVFG